MNTETPRVFIAATRQNDGKTTVSLGLLAALQSSYPRIGYIKPVGQRFVRIDEQSIDEDTILMDHVYRLNCPLSEMSPIAVEPDFTRKYLQSSNYEVLVKRIQKAFDRVSWEKEFVLCEGSGHAGVGSVFDLSNARVAKLLHAKVVIVTRGGIGKPIDEVALNMALFEKEGVEVIGVIVNKVTADKFDYITEFARKGLKRKGLELLGVIPHQPILSRPTMESIRDELNAELINNSEQLMNQVDEVIVGAMSVQNAISLLQKGVLLIASADREDMVLAATTTLFEKNGGLAGMILTGKARPNPIVWKVIQRMPFPVILTSQDIYVAASKVHDLIVKTRPNETQKISLIRDIVAKCVDVDRILKAL
ncbi:MAG: AAA family ATPase [Verrucomicrobia bacterium]|nr:AAA family ATPase [Verrucomicrobiota bacterium]